MSLKKGDANMFECTKQRDGWQWKKLARARSFEAAYKMAGRCFLVVGKHS